MFSSRPNGLLERFDPSQMPRPDRARFWLLPSELLDRRDQPLDILRARQPMVAILDQREHDVVARDPRDELDRMLPGHVGVLDPLQDTHRAAGLDHAAEQKMVAPL